MQEGFPFKKKITSRGNSVNYGGDYRYRYDLCPRARTVVVTDTSLDIGTFSSLSITSTARVATIALTAGYFYHSIVYRSKGQQVYVFGTQNVIIIDANPSSVNFNTIINTITTTSFNSTNFSIVYSEAQDLFVTFFGKFNPDLSASNTSLLSSTIPGYYTSCNAYYQNIGGSGSGGQNGEVFSIHRHFDESLVVYLGINTSIPPLKINNKWYCGVNAQFFRLNISGIREALIGITSTSRGDASYSQVSSHIVITNYNGTSIPIVSVSPTFASVGNLYSLLTTILATNHTSCISVQYSPFSKKIYLRPANMTTVNSSGLDRYYIIDTTQSLANMAIGYRTIDEGGVTMSAQYMNSISCFNGLKINEYDF